VGEGKPVAPSFLLASVLWSDVRDGWAQRVAERQHSHPALQDAIDDVFNARIGDVSGRGKLAGDMREIWMMQPRFEKRVGSAPFGLAGQERFRAAFDFMRLRADAGEVDELLADWWQEFSTADDDLRQDLVDQVREEQQQRQRAPRVHRAPRPAGAAPVADEAAAGAGGTANTNTTFNANAHSDSTAFSGGEPGEGDAGAPRKRRRRRRTGGAGRSADGGGPGSSSGAGE
jgi:poly(A) polymerase